MPRKPRFFLPNIPVHIVVRGNSKGAVFVEDEDYKQYLHLLKEAAGELDCEIHAYVLMTNHVHILVRALEPGNISRLSQYIGRQYVPYFNHKYGRSGTLWEGRFKASSVDSQRYLIACYRYIEMNPVRAGMVNHPADYPWSSYASNAEAAKNALITPHPEYLAFGRSRGQRAKRYKETFDELSAEQLNRIREGVQTGTPIGNQKFMQEVERLLGTKVGYAKRGRPRKQ